MPIVFYGNFLVYNLRHSEFRICYKRFCKLTIYPCKIYLQLFYHKHISFQQKFPPLCTRPSPWISAWGDDEVLEMKRRLKKLGGYANDNVSYSFITCLMFVFVFSDFK